MSTRRDPLGNILLPRMYYRSGRYYYVKLNKWIALPKVYSLALRRYALHETPRSDWGDLVTLAYTTYQKRLADGRIAENTHTQYEGLRHKIIYGFGDFAPHEIKMSDVTQFLELYSDTPAMANRMLSVLKAIFDKGCRTGACDFNPAHGVKRYQEGKRSRYLTDSEYIRIHDHANAQTRLIMDLCYMTAQRIGDVLKIEHKDISKDGILIKQQKTGKEILFPLTPEIELLIKKAKRLRKVMCRYLFHPTGKNTQYSYKAIYDSYKRACIAAKVKDTTLHDLRAKSLTDAKKEGIDAQKLAGHSNPAMTERYIRLRETDVISGPTIRKFNIP